MRAVVVLSSATTAETVKAELETRLKEYLASLVAEKYGTIYYGPEEDRAYTVIYNRVLALLLTIDGVENATSLTVNGAAADMTVQPDEVPTPGTVEVTA